MEHLLTLYAQFEAATRTNPVLAGVVSLWGLTVATLFMRTVPTKLANFFTKQCTTSLMFNNAGWSGNEQQFHAFMAWFSQTRWIKWSRYLSVEGRDYSNVDGSVVIGAGYGKHFFWHKGHLFWFERRKLESAGTAQEKNEIFLSTLGRSQRPLLELVEEFRYRPATDSLGVYGFKDNSWDRVTHIRKRPLTSVVIEAGLKQRLLGDLSHFFGNRAWFDERGLPYKMTVVLHGKPGTGKTSLIAALASHFDRNVCVLNLAGMTDATFELAMSCLPDNSVVVIEDFDSSGAVRAREEASQPEEVVAEAPAPGVPAPAAKPRLSRQPINEGHRARPRGAAVGGAVSGGLFTLSLSKVLNTLDGIVRLDNTVVFMTTNHLGSIDPALLRKGRVDHIHEVKLLTDPEVREYIALMYPEAEVPQWRLPTMAGCDLQALFLEHKEDYMGFRQALYQLSREGGFVPA